MLKDNIALLRNFINISQRELGRRIDMTGQYIAKIEKGERMPTPETIDKIASALSDNMFDRKFYPEELTSHPYTMVEMLHKNLIARKQNFDLIRRCLHISSADTANILKGLVPLDTYGGLDWFSRQLGINPSHLDKYLDLDASILSMLTPEEASSYYSSLEKSYLLWSNECKFSLGTRLMNKIYTILSPTKSKDELIDIFTGLTKFSHEQISQWVTLSTNSSLRHITLDYSVQNSLLLYLYTLNSEECSTLINNYPFDIHPYVKRYYEQLTGTITSTNTCSIYILSEYLLSHNFNISELNNEQLQALDDELKNFITYQLYKLSHNLDS